MQEYTIRVSETLADVSPTEWDALAGGNPTLSHAWLQSMIDTGATTAKTGWLPQFLLLTRPGADGTARLTGAIPLYMKGHSYGEYVFDWAWADAYQRADLDYYPKLLVAVPFTPCNGSRILAATDADRAVLIDALIATARDSAVSSLHVLFATDDEHATLTARGLLARQSVQFHWVNRGDGEERGYADFDAFLATMTHDKRKRIRQERRRVREAGVTFRHVTGYEATSEDWDFFTACYDGTYRAHRSTPYLSRDFFGQIGSRMPDQVLLIIAERDGLPVASSLNLIGDNTLYGRYWGATEFISGLHFETCYYQGIEAAIQRNLRVFEGGAQGEHKLARGFEPVNCHSAHWLRDPRFHDAVANFLKRESNGIAHYVNELENHLPFREADQRQEEQ